ncbi:MFS transporter [Microbacterium arabinogalactanolyticum]|uniref:MFS transporter n=1 Tax=Microbacterium arabinogalactanolyticum TaxID=69365 RepID=UPI004044BD90
MTSFTAPVRVQSAALAATPPTLRAAGLLTLLLGGLLGNFVFGVSMIALPAMTADLGMGGGAGSLLVTIFLLGFASSLVLGGRLGDRYGRRRLFRIGALALAATSVLVAVSPESLAVLSSRFAEGVAIGLMLPQVLATIQNTAEGRRRAAWIGLYVAVIGAGTMLGQLITGAVVALPWGALGWRAAFVVVALIAGVAAAAASAVPETRVPGGGIDVVGAVLLSLTVGCLLAALAVHGSALLTVGLAAGAVVTGGVLVLWERRMTGDRALLPAVAMREPALVIGLALNAIFFTGYGAFVYYFVFAAENGMGLTAIQTAGTLVVFAAAFVAVSVIAPRLHARLPARTLMVAGTAVQGLTLAGVALWAAAGWPAPQPLVLQALLGALGGAQALMYAPLVGTVMNAVPPAVAGMASGLFSTVQQVALALGVAIFSLVYAAADAGGGEGLVVCALVQAGLAVPMLVIVLLARRTLVGRTH